MWKSKSSEGKLKVKLFLCLQYQVKISYKFATLEDLDGSVDISRAWKSIS